MGIYTEFHYRAHIKPGPVAEWLHSVINNPGFNDAPFDDHPFFQTSQWVKVFRTGGGLNNNITRPTVFEAHEHPSFGYRLIIASALKNYDLEVEKFAAWIDPHVLDADGRTLGYSYCEQAWDYAPFGSNGWIEPGDMGSLVYQPIIYRAHRKPVSVDLDDQER